MDDVVGERSIAEQGRRITQARGKVESTQASRFFRVASGGLPWDKKPTPETPPSMYPIPVSDERCSLFFDGDVIINGDLLIILQIP